MNIDTEKMRVAVLAECETVCPDTFRPRVLHSRFVAIWRKLKWNLEPYFEVIIGCNTLVVDETFEHWDFLYHALGLSERDAVEAEKARLLKRYKARIKRLRADDAETHRIQMEVKDERIAALEAKNAALVAALESLKRAVGYKPRRHGEIVLYRNDLGVFIDNALAANEKGGVQG